ncbi:MAG: hypothetical protein OXT67_00590 [Zetaproteobacteria bacterium]|nr:hypothetical protein [Zetaproteobacteria bacterium]
MTEQDQQIYTICGKVLPPEEAGQIHVLQDIIRQLSADKLRCQTGDARLDLDTQIEGDQSILGHWLSMILISGRRIKITFKVHFNTAQGQEIILKKVPVARPQKIEKHFIFDRLKEFCNLTAGSIKECLGAENSKTGLSLPVITRGFDEVIFFDSAHKSGKGKIRDVWALRASDFAVHCSSEIQVLDWNALQDIRFIRRDSDQQGDLEFL